MREGNEDQTAVVSGWLVAAVLGTLLLGFWTIWEPFGRDQGIHASIGFALGDGLLTYRDVYNVKAPMTTLTHLLSQVIFGHHVASIRLLDLVLVMATALGIFAFVRRWGQPALAALFAALMLPAYYYMLTFWEHSQTDGWGGFTTVACMLALQRGWQVSGRGRGWFLLAGSMIAVAFAYKYPVAGAGLVVFAPYLVRQGARTGGWRALVWFATGLFGTVAALILAMMAAGIWEAFLEIQGYGTRYFDLPQPFAQSALEAMLSVVARHTVLGGIFGLGLILLPLRSGLGPLAKVAIALWLVMGALSGVAQGKGFEYHYLPMLPPVAIIAGLGLYELLTRLLPNAAPRPRSAVLLTLAALFLLQPAQRSVATLVMLAEGASPTARWERDLALADYSFTDLQALSAEIDAMPGPKDTMFVWGFATGLYFLQNIPPRYRYPYSWPQIVGFSDHRYDADLLARLDAVPPAVFIVQKLDVAPQSTGTLHDSREMMENLPALKQFLTSRYHLAREETRFEIWQLNRT